MAIAEVLRGDDSSAQVSFEQDFARLEEAIESGVWEVDADGDTLYVSEAGDTCGPPGAVVVSGGLCCTELVHWLVGESDDSQGIRIKRIALQLVLEELDENDDSPGMFTLGVSFDEDFEEAAILAVTLKRPRRAVADESDDGVQSSGRESAKEENDRSETIALMLNGDVAIEDIGALPARIHIDVAFCWDTGKIHLLHRITPSKEECSEVTDTSDVKSPVVADFYTRGSNVKTAKAICLRSTGVIKVRLLHLRCQG